MEQKEDVDVVSTNTEENTTTNTEHTDTFGCTEEQTVSIKVLLLFCMYLFTDNFFFFNKLSCVFMCINKIEALVYFYQGRWNEIFLGEEYTSVRILLIRGKY